MKFFIIIGALLYLHSTAIAKISNDENNVLDSIRPPVAYVPKDSNYTPVSVSNMDSICSLISNTYSNLIKNDSTYASKYNSLSENDSLYYTYAFDVTKNGKLKYIRNIEYLNPFSKELLNSLNHLHWNKGYYKSKNKKKTVSSSVIIGISIKKGFITLEVEDLTKDGFDPVIFCKQELK